MRGTCRSPRFAGDRGDFESDLAAAAAQRATFDHLRSHVPDYVDAGNYVEAPAARDRKLITASGLGDVESAREIFEEAGRAVPRTIAAPRAHIFCRPTLPAMRRRRRQWGVPTSYFLSQLTRREPIVETV